VQGRNGYLYRVRDGKIARAAVYTGRDDALEASGWRE